MFPDCEFLSFLGQYLIQDWILDLRCIICWSARRNSEKHGLNQKSDFEESNTFIPITTHSTFYVIYGPIILEHRLKTVLKWECYNVCSISVMHASGLQYGKMLYNTAYHYFTIYCCYLLEICSFFHEKLSTKMKYVFATKVAMSSCASRWNVLLSYTSTTMVL